MALSHASRQLLPYWPCLLASSEALHSLSPLSMTLLLTRSFSIANFSNHTPASCGTPWMPVCQSPRLVVAASQSSFGAQASSFHSTALPLQPQGAVTSHTGKLLLLSGHQSVASVLCNRTGPQQAAPATCYVQTRHRGTGFRQKMRSLRPLLKKASQEAVKDLIKRPDPDPPAEQLNPYKSFYHRYKAAPLVDTCLPPMPEAPKPAYYRKVGEIQGEYRLQTEQVFAVIDIQGAQHKVTTDDIIFVNKTKGVSVNDVLSLDRVLLLGSATQTVIGRPYVPRACVLAAVEEIFKDGKVHTFYKMITRRYKSYKTIRPQLTTLRILQIRGIQPSPGDELQEPNLVPIKWTVDVPLAGSPDLTEELKQLQLAENT